MKVGSLFSGAGGFDLGFEAAGFDVAWQVEIDRDCVSVLERHWPGVPRWGDVSTVDPADLAPVDVVIFGSPCQDFSVAGKRAGLEGARSGLFGEAIRIIRGLRPTPAFCVWENVPGALSSAGGRDFGAVLDALADIGALDIAWRVLDARHFGVPQRRRRIFLVADFGAERAGQVLFESEGGGGDLEACGEAGEGLAGDTESGVGVVGVANSLLGYAGRNQLEANYVPVVPDFVRQAISSKWSKGSSGPADDEYHNLIATGAATAPAWIPCPCCEDFVCTIHEMHAHDCECPSIEEWETDPYAQGGQMAVASSDAASYGNGSPRGNGSDNLIVAEVANTLSAGAGGKAGGHPNDFSANYVVAASLTGGGHPNSNAPGRHREDDDNLVVAPFDQAQITSRANRSRVSNGSPAPTLNGSGGMSVTHTLSTRSGATEDGTGRGTPIAAAGYAIPMGSYVSVEGVGTFRVADRGMLGPTDVDIAVYTRAEAYALTRTAVVCVGAVEQ